VPEIVDAIATGLPDPAILALSALAFGLLGGAVALLSNRLWFRRWSGHTPFEDRLADTAHTSLLGFSVFVLALLITSGFSSLSRTEEAARREALQIQRLGRELDALGPSGLEAKRALVSYSRDVAGDEWARLARAPKSLSPLVQTDLTDLWRSIRAIQRNADAASPNVRDELGQDLAQIETLRAGRLSAATNDIPAVFWLILILFVAAASLLAGREAPKRFGMQVNLIHMSAIGLAVGLVVILDDPFRGETSVTPAIIRDALSFR
jgi:hypothetical protein